MLTTLGPSPTPLVPLSTQSLPPLQAKWIGSPPRLPSTMTRIRLAEGVWIVPKQHRGYGPPAWMKGGLCTQLDTTESDPLFFGVERRKAPGQLIAASNIAKLICKQCPVRATCLTNALVNDERYGVWGGTSGRQRAKLRTRLSKGAGVGELVSECLDKAGA